MGSESAAQDVEKGKAKKDDASSSGDDDPSTKIWNLSLERSSEHDASMVRRWKGDMDGILIYTGIFSATVAAFLIDSYKYLKPDPTEVTSKLLQQVTQELAGLSVGDRFSTPDLESFRVRRTFVHVNMLWFLSLCLSLGCGLFASLVQQWLRRYLRLTQLSEDPIIRVRCRTYLHTGIHRFHMSWVVENISLLLHAAIFLFFAGLVEFLLAFNHEVAHLILVAVSVLAACYISLTFLPVIYRNCPFQTPLTSTLWYTGHFIAVTFWHLVDLLGPKRTGMDKPRKQYGDGPDQDLMGQISNDVGLDKDALEMTLNMCRNDNEVEAFVDAIPGYLQAEREHNAHIQPNVSIRISNIGSLLRKKTGEKTGEKTGDESRLRHRLVTLFASCTNDHRRMDDGARRRRAITCSRAIWEMSKVYLSIKPKDVTLDLPMSIGRTLDRLTRDIDYEIRVSALKTRAMFNCAHMKRPADAGAEAQKEKVHYPSENIVLALPEVVGSMTSPPPLTPSPSYQVVEQRDDKPYDERLTTVKEYTLGILELIPHLGKPSHMDLEETQTTFEELCRELHGRKFSPADQEHLSVAASNAHSALGNAGGHPSGDYYVTMTRLLVSMLDEHHAEPLRQRGL